MSDLITVPETLASAAADVQSIGSTIDAAGTNAAARTTGLLAAAADEVSAAIANLFGAYGREYQALLGQAASFHSQFTQALGAAAAAYAQAEATNAAVLSGTSTGSTPLSVVQLASGGDPLFALIMGGTNNPQPDPKYVTSVFNSYIKPAFPTAIPQGLFTPEQFWPVTPQLGNMTFGQSVAKGVTLLNNALVGPTGVITQGNSAVVFGYSQSATIATNEINALLAAGSPIPANQLSFVLIGDPNNPVGGILERFPGFYIPFLDVAFNGATPQSPWHTSVYTYQYDGIADAPQYPLNLVSDLNAFMGYFFVHGQYPLLTATQVGTAVPLPTNGGNTDYYMFMTQNLPLLEPIRAIPYAGPPIADIFQPDLRVLVDLGYGDYGPGANYANIPTPAGLFDLPNPFTVIPDLALGAVQGPYGAAVEIGVEAGLLSPSYFPDTYPWVPSINPGLNISFGQSSTTLLSLLSGATGNVLHLIPPPNFG
ncbi:PE-PPE domain-containing protein [Mycobacterium sp. 1081908.1]|uniref:PE family protein n=1 Tax=Mycobacterium sp. 1081908.1 TaxID=1834066 RepID=UPI0007FDD584|nr:PE-PPE domain-containing protein [Mycobacterium sp. 1081908.1]OBK53257.1 PE family protein [Mycobacterium sp. 1081908.1]